MISGPSSWEKWLKKANSLESNDLGKIIINCNTGEAEKRLKSKQEILPV